MSVRFRPTAVGVRSASIEVTSNAPGSPHSVPLSGTGVGPVANVSPLSIAFGNQRRGTESAARTITVSNAGQAPLVIGKVSLAGQDPNGFRLGPRNTCSGRTVQPGARCIIDVRFRPKSLGSQDAQVVIPHNAANSPTRVEVSGTGT